MAEVHEITAPTVVNVDVAGREVPLGLRVVEGKPSFNRYEFDATLPHGMTYEFTPWAEVTEGSTRWLTVIAGEQSGTVGWRVGQHKMFLWRMTVGHDPRSGSVITGQEICPPDEIPEFKDHEVYYLSLGYGIGTHSYNYRMLDANGSWPDNVVTPLEVPGQ